MDTENASTVPAVAEKKNGDGRKPGGEGQEKSAKAETEKQNGNESGKRESKKKEEKSAKKRDKKEKSKAREKKGKKEKKSKKEAKRSASNAKKESSRDDGKKKRKRKSRSRSRSDSRSPSRSRRKDSGKDRRKKSRSSSSSSSSSSSDRSRSRHKKRDEKKRKRSRTRTRSPIRKRSSSPIRRPVIIGDTDPNKPKYFWDGFQWVARTNSVPNIDPNILNQTRKMRRIQISNIPLYMGLSERDVQDIVTKFLIDNYLNDKDNKCPVVSCQLNTQGNYAVLEISSVEETNRLIKIDSSFEKEGRKPGENKSFERLWRNSEPSNIFKNNKAIKIFNHICKITRLGETMYGQTTNLATLVNNAQATAQAQAAAFAALQLVQNKDGLMKFSLGKSQTTPPSRIIKISNIIQPERARTLADEELDEIFIDIGEEFDKHGKIKETFMVRAHQAAIGAESGCMFMEFSELEGAQSAMNAMMGRKFDNNELKMIYIDEEVYMKNFKHLMNVKKN